jgi:hypothetical protein
VGIQTIFKIRSGLQPNPPPPTHTHTHTHAHARAPAHPPSSTHSQCSETCTAGVRKMYLYNPGGRPSKAVLRGIKAESLRLYPACDSCTVPDSPKLCLCRKKVLSCSVHLLLAAAHHLCPSLPNRHMPSVRQPVDSKRCPFHHFYRARRVRERCSVQDPHRFFTAPGLGRAVSKIPTVFTLYQHSNTWTSAKVPKAAQAVTWTRAFRKRSRQSRAAEIGLSRAHPGGAAGLPEVLAVPLDSCDTSQLEMRSSAAAMATRGFSSPGNFNEKLPACRTRSSSCQKQKSHVRNGVEGKNWTLEVACWVRVVPMQNP